MSTLELIQLIALIIIAVFSVIYYICKAIKEHWLEQLTNTIENAIKYAEANIKDGKEKKAYVLEQVKIKCEELGIPYHLLEKIIKKLIDRIIKDYNILVK